MNHLNWAENLAYTAAEIRFPRSAEEAQEIVAAASHIKPLGTRHSFTDVADSPGGVLVSLAEMPSDIRIDRRSSTVSLSPGTIYSELAGELERNGFALANLASLPHISVGGATATATHGSGDTNGVLSTSISAIELIKADGTNARVDRSSNDLAALAVGIGAFGLFTRIELDIEPTYQVRQYMFSNPRWETVIEDLDTAMAMAYSVSLMGDIGAETMNEIWLKQRLDRSPTPIDVDTPVYGGTHKRIEDLRPGHSLTPIAGMPGPWSERLAHFTPEGTPSTGGDELQSEYFVARNHGAAALRALRSMGDRISPQLYGMEIRTIAADDLWLSPAYQRATLSLGFTWRKRPDQVTALLPDIEAALAPFDPRPHFGKLFAMTNAGARFPRYKDFMRLVDAYDPDGKFWNPFIERLGIRTT